jgi:phosphoenolpyruvate carboxylase
MSLDSLQAYQELVNLKYEMFTAAFLKVPYDELKESADQLEAFEIFSYQSLLKGITTTEIVKDFFRRHSGSDLAKQNNTLLLFLRILERRLFLLQALETAAFPETHDVQGPGCLKYLLNRVRELDTFEQAAKMTQQISFKLVITADRSFYHQPEIVKQISQELIQAIEDNNLVEVRNRLTQITTTAFRSRVKSTLSQQLQTAISVLDRTLYPVISALQEQITTQFHYNFIKNTAFPSQLGMGIWLQQHPSPLLEELASHLKVTIIERYLELTDQLKNRLTSLNLSPKIKKIETFLMHTRHASRTKTSISPTTGYTSPVELLHDLIDIRTTLEQQLKGLYLHAIDQFIIAVRTFGFYFGSLEIELDSALLPQAVHEILEFHRINKLPLMPLAGPYPSLDPSKKLEAVQTILKNPTINLSASNSKVARETDKLIETFHALKEIQAQNGPDSAHRLIVNGDEVHQFLEPLALARWAGWGQHELSLDIVPLFKTITAIQNAPALMKKLFTHAAYSKHLAHRSQKQTVVIDLAEAIKNGGYFAGIWTVLVAKQELSVMTKYLGISLTFMEGPTTLELLGNAGLARLYRCTRDLFEQSHLEIPVEAETLRQSFKRTSQGSFYLEQLLTSSLESTFFPNPFNQFSEEDIRLLNEIADTSCQAYQTLTNMPNFMAFFNEIDFASASQEYGHFEQIPAAAYFKVWRNARQNIWGYFGLGSALQKLFQRGNEPEIKRLFDRSFFFRVIIATAMDHLGSTFLPLTHYLQDHQELGPIWKAIHAEAELTVTAIQKILGTHTLSEANPVSKLSQANHERLYFPMQVIQHYAAHQLKHAETLSESELAAYQKMLEIATSTTSF